MTNLSDLTAEPVDASFTDIPKEFTSPDDEVISVEETYVAQSIITLTATSDAPGGFTIGMALHAFSGGEITTIPPVDVVAIAVSNILKTTPQVFVDEINGINAAIQALSVALDTNEGLQAAIDRFNEVTGLGINVNR